MATPMMRAGIATAAGIGLHDVPRPVPGESEILVKVVAIGVDRADLGSSKAQEGAGLTIPGLEWSGQVTQVGAKVTTLKPGDWVMCNAQGGGYAEYAVTDAGRAIQFDPKEIDVQQAAVMPLALMTCHDALSTQGQLKPGGSVLVNGASSGVGIAMMLVAKALGAKLIAGTSRDPEKQKKLPDFGATLVLDSSKPDWPDALLAATGGKGVEVVADMVAGATVNDSLKALAVKGRMVNVGRLAGGHGDFNFDLHALKRITYTGVTFRTRSVEEVREIVVKMKADLWTAVREKRLTLPVDRVFKLAAAAEAHATMAANAQFGKIVLVP